MHLTSQKSESPDESGDSRFTVAGIWGLGSFRGRSMQKRHVSIKSQTGVMAKKIKKGELGGVIDYTSSKENHTTS